ncbi:LAGLIDADG family homing endonuclease [Candidatus Woesearchaeota archaeon]|nr:LAGLIDADG family homing endonuclease [Candidatus Woesearchaeota archaeon]
MNNEKFNKSKNIMMNKVLDLYEFLNKKEFFELAKRMSINNIKIKTEGQLLKFRRWEPGWQVPSQTRIREEIVKYSGSRKNQDIIKRGIWAKIEPLDDFKSRWVKSAPKYWGNQAKIPYELKNDWVWCKIHDNWIFNGLVPRPQDFIYKDKWLYYRIPKGYLGIAYTSADYHANLILVPSSIKTDYFFFEGLGLQQGDGTQALSDVHITFTNGCVDLILHQINWFKNLGVSKNALRIYPEIPKSHEREFQEIKQKIMGLGINENQFRKKKSFLTNTKNVLIQLVFHNKLFKLVYLNLLYQLNKDILKNRDYIKPYLRGLIAAEGCVRLRKGCVVLQDIKISASSQERRDFIKKCLTNLGIIPSKDELTKGSEAVIVGRYENFLRLRELNALHLHPEKRDKFINGFLSYQRRGGIKDG